MKFLRRILMGALKALGVAIALIVTTGLVLFFFPGILVRDATLPWAKRIARGLDVDVQWKQGHWSAKSESIWRKGFTLDLEAPCYRQAEPLVDACLEHLRFEGEYDVRTGRVFVEQLKIPGGRVVIEGGATEPPAKAEPGTPFTPLKNIRAIRDLLASLNWNEVAIEKIAFLYTSPGSAIRLRLGMQGVRKEEGRHLQANATGRLSSAGVRTPVQAELWLQGKNEGPLDFGIDGYWGESRRRLTAHLKGKLTDEEFNAEFSGQMLKPVSGVKHVDAHKCQIVWKQAGDGPADLRLDCPVSALLSPSLAGASLNRVFRAEGLDKPVHAKVAAQVKLPGGDFEKADGSVQFSAVDLRTTSLEAEVTASFDTAVKHDPLTAAVKLTAPDFAALVRRLQSTPFAVPAPFNQLDGRVTLNAKGRTDLTFQRTNLEFSVGSELASDFQKLAFSGDGKVFLKPVEKRTEIDFDANVVFQDTKLSLPRLDPTNLPQLLPDPDIIYPTGKKTTSETLFKYKVGIKTEKGHPIVLHTNQFNLDVPLVLDLIAQSEVGLTGTLTIPKFKADLFRRDATVRKVSIRFSPDAAAELSARVDIHYAEYDLTLAAFGALDSPRYNITSNPPLSEPSALSLLLFGRPLEELSPGQGESLGNARAALTNGAISAASMYLLASTPIESIGYDPTQGRFLATVRLVEGTSLRIESAKEGVTQLGIRKRLGRDWILNTYVERNSPMEDRRSVSTFLEWSKTY